jgi:hypothetical protein
MTAQTAEAFPWAGRIGPAGYGMVLQWVSNALRFVESNLGNLGELFGAYFP